MQDGFQICNFLVCSDPSHDHRSTVDRCPASTQQGLPRFGFDRSSPPIVERLKCSGVTEERRAIIAAERIEVANGESGSSRGLFGKLRIDRDGVLAAKCGTEIVCEQTGNRVGRGVDTIPSCDGREVGIELGERRLNTLSCIKARVGRQSSSGGVDALGRRNQVNPVHFRGSRRCKSCRHLPDY